MSTANDEDAARAQAKLASISYLDSHIPPQGQVLLPNRALSLDSELQILDELVVLAKRRRNAHNVYLLRLPVEVLAMILLEVKTIWKPDMTRLSEAEQEELDEAYADEPEKWRLSRIMASDYHVLGWLNMTFVCSTLRDVALTSPALWCDIECNKFSPSFAQAIETRSAGQPVRFSIDYLYDSLDRSLEWTRTWLTPSICGRIQRLKLSDFMFEDLLDIVNSMPPFPSLVDFSLSLDEDFNVPRGAVDLALNLSASQQLTHLAFHNCFPPLSNAVFSPCVTHLILSASFFRNWPCVPTVDELLDLLAPMTRLVELCLDYVPRKHPHDNEAISTHRLVLPPTLRQLECSSDLRRSTTVPDFISRIEFPRGVFVNVIKDKNHGPGSTEGPTRFKSHFACFVDIAFKAAHMPAEAPWNLLLANHELSILIGEERTPHCQLYPRVSFSWGDPDAKSTLIRITHRTSIMLPNPDTLRDLNQLFQLLPLSHLTSLALSHPAVDILFPQTCPEEQGRMANRLLTSPSIHHLALGLFLSDYCHVFRNLAKVHHQDDQITTPVIFPSLRSITIVIEADPTALGEDEVSDLKEEFMQFFTELLAAVDARQHCAQPMREVRVQKQLSSTYRWETVTQVSVVFI